MPQTKLTSFKLTTEPKQTRRPGRPGQQRRLDDLEKISRIEGGKFSFDPAELLRAKQVLEAPDAPDAELLATLRRLSCLHITRELLLRVQIGASLRLLKKHANQDVARIAHTLVEKWKALIHDERGRAAKPAARR